MKKRCLIHIFILKILLVKEIFSKFAYFDFIQNYTKLLKNVVKIIRVSGDDKSEYL